MNAPEHTSGQRPAQNDEQRLEELLSADRTGRGAAETLWSDRWWVSACADAARTGSAWLDDGTPAGHDSLPERVRRLLAEYNPSALPAAQATLHAARAAYCLAHRSGRRAVRHRVLAVLARAGAAEGTSPDDLVWPEGTGGSWSALPDDAGPPVPDALADANPHLPWDQIDELIQLLGSGPLPVTRTRTVPVIADTAGAHVIRLYLTAVEDPRERALPEASFATLLPDASPTTAQIARAFAWARAREGFPRGTGLRWQLLGDGGRPVSDCLPIEAGGAAAVGLTWMFLPRVRQATRQDPSVVVHATLAPNGLLLPAPAAPEQPGPGGGPPLVVATGDRLSAARSAASGALRPRGSVADAWKATRRPKGRRTAALSVLTVLVLLAGAGLGLNALLSSQNYNRQQAADELASAAIHTGPDSPAEALRRALASSALDAGSPRVQQALLLASRSEKDISRVVPTGLRPLRQLALSADGRYLAAVGSNRELRLWDTLRVEEVTPVHAPKGVDTMAFAPRGDLLAVSGDAGTQLWDISASRATHTLAGAEAAISLAFDAAARSLAAGTADGELLLWRTAVRPGERPLTVGRRTLPVRSVCFPSADALAATGDDRTVTLWNTRKPGAPPRVAKLLSAGSAVMCAAGRRVLAVDGSKLYLLSPTLTKVREPMVLDLYPGAVYRPKTDAVLVVLTNSVKEITVDKLASLDDEAGGLGSGTLYAVNSHPGKVAAAGGDGTTVAVPTSEGDVRIYRDSAPDNPPDRRVWATLATYPLRQGHRLLLVGGGTWGRGQLTLTDSRTDKVVAHLALGDRMRSRGGQPTAFSAEHDLVATPMESKGLLLTRIRGSRFGLPTALPRPAVPPDATPGVRNQTLTPLGAAFDDTRDLLFAFWGRSVVTYRISGGGAPKEISRTTVDPSPGGMTLSDDGSLLFTNTNRGQRAHSIDAAGRVAASSALVSARPALLMAPGPDRSLFTASVTGQVFRYTRHTRTGLWTEHPLRGHDSLPTLLRVDGDLLVSAGQDDILRLARAKDGQELGQVAMPRSFVATVERVSGGTLQIRNPWDQRVSVPVGVAALRRQACDMLGGAAPHTVAEAWPGARTGGSTGVCRSS
ncbi:hypothetical protein AB0N79_39560 [Streptomyces microflavus]|uniref:hypothetical protein n=1 Tax=Streptomyces microflavus TaxID=1919 RepID=UPI0034342DF9